MVFFILRVWVFIILGIGYVMISIGRDLSRFIYCKLIVSDLFFVFKEINGVEYVMEKIVRIMFDF